MRSRTDMETDTVSLRTKREAEREGERGGWSMEREPQGHRK